MIEGIHLASPDDGFARCRIEIPYFENWLGDSPFAFDLVGSGESFRLDYARPGDEDFHLDACKSLVRFVRSVRLPGFPSHEPSIGHRAYVELESSEPMPASWFCNQASEIVDLISLMYGGRVQSRELALSQSILSDDAATLYYPRPKVSPIEYGTSDIVIRYENVKELFADILNGWLTASEVIKSARRILLSSERRPSPFIELRFLPLVHAAEILTKEIGHSTIIAQETFRDAVRQMLASLPTGLPSELTESIKNCLGWANGRSLKYKLNKLLSYYQDATCDLFCKSKEAFINGVVDTRNFYTHYSAKKNLLQDAELHWAIQKTALMLRILLLLKAGVPEIDLQRLVRSNRRLAQDRAVWCKITEEGSPFHDTDNN
jgi:hypothetical protein